MTEEFAFEPAEHIKLDLYPATVRSGDLVVAPESRLIVTDAHIYAISTDGIGQPYFMVKDELIEIQPEGPGYRIAGANQDYYAVRDTSCGCGSRLRGMRFLPGVPHASRLSFNNNKK